MDGARTYLPLAQPQGGCPLRSYYCEQTLYGETRKTMQHKGQGQCMKITLIFEEEMVYVCGCV